MEMVSVLISSGWIVTISVDFSPEVVAQDENGWISIQNQPRYGPEPRASAYAPLAPGS
jgi:hypothetical protein